MSRYEFMQTYERWLSTLQIVVRRDGTTWRISESIGGAPKRFPGGLLIPVAR